MNFETLKLYLLLSRRRFILAQIHEQLPALALLLFDSPRGARRRYFYDLAVYNMLRAFLAVWIIVIEYMCMTPKISAIFPLSTWFRTTQPFFYSRPDLLSLEFGGKKHLNYRKKQTTGAKKQIVKAEFLFWRKYLKKEQKKHNLLREIFGSQAHNCHHKIEIEFKVHLLKITTAFFSDEL